MSPARYIAVVRRGETEIYRLLKEYLEARGVAEVVWDRRAGERRLAAGAPQSLDERRRTDRRRTPVGLGTSQALGFFITRAGEPDRAGRAERPGA